MNNLNQHKALLFVNGEKPHLLPTEIQQYRYIACTDGAYSSYVANSPITPHFIIGDLDSLKLNDAHPRHASIDIIHTPDQNKTDFEKAILFLAEKGITEFDIYGVSGRASDHFLGNLSVAMQYYKHYQLNFYDDYGYFHFASNRQTLEPVLGKVISLIPLSTVTGLTLSGFEYPLTDQTLTFGGQISLRNRAIQDTVTLSFNCGDLLVFIEHDNH